MARPSNEEVQRTLDDWGVFDLIDGFFNLVPQAIYSIETDYDDTGMNLIITDTASKDVRTVRLEIKK